MLPQNMTPVHVFKKFTHMIMRTPLALCPLRPVNSDSAAPGCVQDRSFENILHPCVRDLQNKHSIHVAVGGRHARQAEPQGAEGERHIITEAL